MVMPAQKPGKSKQDYGTPPELLAAVKQRLCIREFAWDLAASADNAVTDSRHWFTEEQNSLIQDWHRIPGWLWLNPPFAKIGPWVGKAVYEARQGANVIMLVPASVGSNWWATCVEHYSYQLFLSPRLTFVGETTPYPKDIALLIYTPLRLTGNQCWNWK